MSTSIDKLASRQSTPPANSSLLSNGPQKQPLEYSQSWAAHRPPALMSQRLITWLPRLAALLGSQLINVCQDSQEGTGQHSRLICFPHFPHLIQQFLLFYLLTNLQVYSSISVTASKFPIQAHATSHFSKVSLTLVGPWSIQNCQNSPLKSQIWPKPFLLKPFSSFLPAA